MKVHILACFMLCMCLMVPTNVQSTVALATPVDLVYHDNTGPYIDTLRYSVISSESSLVQALIDGNIDMIADTIDPSYRISLQSLENVSLDAFYRNGYGYFTINCAEYPLNITAFRKAAALALDKERIISAVWDTLGDPLDSVIPRGNPLSIEGTYTYDYYDNETDAANLLLDDAGFDDYDDDDFREAPDGSEISVAIEYPSSSTVASETAGILAEAMQGIGIDAQAIGTDFADLYARIVGHGDYDIAFLSKSLDGFDITWMADEFWSGNVDEDTYNQPNFENAEFDSYREQFLTSTDFEDAKEAGEEMQKILIDECPVIIAYQNYYLMAYRTDRFTGFVRYPFESISNVWSHLNTRLKTEQGGPIGGELRVGVQYPISSLNFMYPGTFTSLKILQNLYDQLMIENNDGGLTPWIAESYSVATHDDDSSIPAGHMYVTMKIIENATWSDGTPLNAQDVAYSYYFYQEATGNPYEDNLENLVSAIDLDNQTVRLWFNSTSYWGLHKAAIVPIIPKHIFIDIEPDDWDSWTPSADELVTSGGLKFNSTSPYILTANPDYFHWTSASPPQIDSPPDQTVYVGTTGNELEWNPKDLDPRNYTLYKNNVVIENSTWDGSSISVDLDTLTAGVYNFTLFVIDRLGQTDTDTVIVTAIADETPPEITSPANISYIEGTTGNSLTWTLDDDHPASFNLYLDGDLLQTGEWNSTHDTVTVSADGLASGEHVYLLQVYDQAGNMASSTVGVTVTSMMLVLGLGAGLVGLIVVVGVVAIKRR